MNATITIPVSVEHHTECIFTGTQHIILHGYIVKGAALRVIVEVNHMEVEHFKIVLLRELTKNKIYITVV